MADPTTFEQIDAMVAATRAAVFVRRVDDVLLIRPEKTLGVNESAAAILEALYRRDGGPAREALEALSTRLAVGLSRLADDTVELLKTIVALMHDDVSPRANVRRETFDRRRIRFPILAEIALTYRCQNRCAFCYASSPHRGPEDRSMTTAQVKRVMDKVFHEAHVPSLSFTGGEATLRPDLEELVRHGRNLGFRVNLITNGIRLADRRYAALLADAGLSSAQISLEAARAGLHDSIVGRPGAFEATVAAVRNLARLGIHVHTNSTLTPANLGHAADLVRFVARELERKTLSINMLIRSGMGLECEGSPISYDQVARTLPALVETARAERVKLVWYSPVPYCIVNPVLLGQGAKACACVDGLLSVSPTGDVLPCSSFHQGIGSLLTGSYGQVRQSAAARYWLEKRFLPPVCEGCPDSDICCGACPLYWDAAGSFQELPRAGNDDAALYQAWRTDRREGASFGVPSAPRRCAAAVPDAAGPSTSPEEA
ncbi:MAG: radical SAM protein [Candidatus Riflebacteria bacterium]|nr:radical SAM protein [Candidatus Riflebacteria bacterium]